MKCCNRPNNKFLSMSYGNSIVTYDKVHIQLGNTHTHFIFGNIVLQGICLESFISIVLCNHYNITSLGSD